MDPERLSPDDPRIAPTLALLQRVFAEMDGRINPPSSMHRMSLAALTDIAATGGLWVMGDSPVATMTLQPKGDTLYVSKLAVASDRRGQGLARRLLTCAAAKARESGLSALQLQSRIELTETHAAFFALGFVRTGKSAHAGFDHPTSITLRKAL
ncbi:MAG: GNAT family N-acetyltransferase [Pseudomonadota bacterium]